MRRLAIPAALLALLLAAPAAKAVDVGVTFDYAVLDTPATPDATVVSPDGEPIKATAAVNETTGAFTIEPAAFDFPQYSFSDPIPGTIDVFLNSQATGLLDFATGQVTMAADFRAEVVTQLGTCNVNTGPITMSTENSEPLPGQRFPAGASGVVTGPGALSVSWQSLSVGSEPGCSLIGQFVNGPGGFWISKGIAPPKEQPQYEVAALGVSVKPKKKTVKKNKKAKFKVTVSNPGDTTASDVELCAKVGKGKRRCIDVGDIAAGARRTSKVTARAKKTSKVVFKATGDGVKAGKAKAKVVIKKKKKRKK